MACHLSCTSVFSHYRLRVSSKGVVVGARTWGGVMVAGESEPLIDAGSVGFPSAAIFAVEHTAGAQAVAVTELENCGAVPDIEVTIPPHASRLRHDTQLEAGIEHAMHLLEKVATDQIPAEIG